MINEPFRVLIASAVRQKPLILREFLASLNRLNRDGILTDCLFIDNNDNSESSEILSSFTMADSKVRLASRQPIETYNCSEETHYWNNNLIWQVAAYKNSILQYALDLNYSHVFMVDSDLVLHPQTLKQLLDTGKDIVSEIFWARWNPDIDELPQVWLEGQYSFYYGGQQIHPDEKNRQALLFLEQLRKPGLYEVGGLGACTLISRNALTKGVNYGKISNVDYWGEDRHFCIRAVVLGFKLYVDTHCPAFHIYRDSDLARAVEYIRRNTPDKETLQPESGPINGWQRKKRVIR